MSPDVSRGPTVGLRRATAPDSDSRSVVEEQDRSFGQDVHTSGHYLLDSRHIQEGNK